MNSMEALTKLVFGMGRLGDHLLRQKVSGIIVAALAFACGAGLAHALKGEPHAAVAVVATQLPAPARAEVSMSDTDVDEEEIAVFDEGGYENHVYGYSVRIPYGLVGACGAPRPQHGFGIDLDDPRSSEWVHGRKFPLDSYMSVEGSYNTHEWKRLDDVVNAHLRYLRDDRVHIQAQSRTRTRLGGLRAARLVVHYEWRGEEMVSDEVFAFRVEEDGARSIVYTLGLTTPLAKYERDRPVLEELMRGWRLQPVE